MCVLVCCLCVSVCACAFPCGQLFDSLMLLTYQLQTAEYGPTSAITGDGELGLDSGEGIRETVSTSKEGSRLANHSIARQGGGDKN